jgi:hypothetical protein
MELFEESHPALLRVVRAVLDLLPSGWTGATLMLRHVRGDDGSFTQSHQIASTEGRDEIVTPNDTLYEATLALSELLRARGKPLATLEITVQWLPDREKWDYSAAFSYANEPS